MKDQSCSLLISDSFVLYRTPIEHPNIRKQISKDALWGLEPLGYEYSNSNLLKLNWGSTWFLPHREVGIILAPQTRRYSGRLTLITKNNGCWVDPQTGNNRFTSYAGMHYPGIACETALYRSKKEFIRLLSEYDCRAKEYEDAMLVYSHFLLSQMKLEAAELNNQI